jgi:hypothetical protein
MAILRRPTPKNYSRATHRVARAGGPAERASERQVRVEKRGGAIELRELPNRLTQDVDDVAESFSSKPLKAQPVHKVDEAKPGEQKG